MINETWLKEVLQTISDNLKSLEKNINDTKKEQKKINYTVNSNPDLLKEKDLELDKYINTYLEKIDKTRTELTSSLDNILNAYKKDADSKRNSIESSISDSKKLLEKADEIIVSLNDSSNDINALLSEMSEIFEKKANEIINEKEKILINDFVKSINKETKKIIPLIEDSKKMYDGLSNQYEKIVKSLKQEQENIVNEVVSEVSKKIIEINPCKNIIINIGDYQKSFKSSELFHEKFESVLALASMKKPTLLKGPAGSGKNVIVEQVAKALNLNLYYINDVTDEFKILGFVDANGNFQQTQFFKAFTQGGVMFIDEIDNSSPSALLAINSAIGTGHNHYMAFPDGNFYQAHEDFRVIAAANTFGTGADSIYCGRQTLDGASLNRFLPIVIDYDKSIEEKVTNNSELLPLFWNIRKIINKNEINHVISTRNIINAVDLLNSGIFSIYDIFDMTIIQGLDKFSLKTISKDLNTNIRYSNELLNHLSNKYNINKNEYKESNTEDYGFKKSYKKNYYGDYNGDYMGGY